MTFPLNVAPVDPSNEKSLNLPLVGSHLRYLSGCSPAGRVIWTSALAPGATPVTSNPNSPTGNARESVPGGGVRARTLVSAWVPASRVTTAWPTAEGSATNGDPLALAPLAASA
jgi:hypothetical protein